jgi:phosphomevalonate kinase
MSAVQRTTVSAPGKVLIAGGYLVLDDSYRGVVVGTTSRFYCSVSPSQNQGITVTAAQFQDESWTYGLGDDVQVEERGEKKNNFVRITLETVFRVAKESIGAQEVLKRVTANGLGSNVVVVGDNDFYSQREQVIRLPCKS